ncbi:MAG: GNAT family N-acetyltransferase [Deltaproteobacteria bacterium]|nr:GNAT family N-acetyltransferase [Deltaproteobacteria bacterium]
MVIETEHLVIHPASQDEMLRFIGKQSDDVLITAYREMLRGCLEHPEQWEWYAIWMIEHKDGTHVGELSFKGFNADGSVEIGYGILEEYQGCGYATEAVEAVVRWALKQPGVTRVEAETEPNNRASQRVLEKCGFLPSGVIGDEGPRFVRAVM